MENKEPIKIFVSPKKKKKEKNSIRDARTPQPGEIVFNTMRQRSSETGIISEQCQCSNNV